MLFPATLLASTEKTYEPYAEVLFSERVYMALM